MPEERLHRRFAITRNRQRSATVLLVASATARW